MPLQMFEIYKILPVFLLVLFRVSGLMLAAPLFSSPAIPLKIKVLMAVAMTMAVFPLLLPQVVVPVTLASAVVGLFGELLIGMFIGFGVTLVFMGVQLAGQLVGHQAGLGLGNVFNPMLEASMGVIPQLFFFISLMIFLGRCRA